MEARITYLRNTRIIHLSDTFKESVSIANSRNEREFLTCEDKIIQLANTLGYKPYKIELFDSNSHTKILTKVNEENKPFKIAAKSHDSKPYIKYLKKQTKNQPFNSSIKKSF